MTRPCNACGAEITFVRTPQGKALPVDGPELVLVTDAGEVVRGRRAHFASCPKADEFRKRTAAKKAEPGLFGDVAPKPAAGGDPL